MAASRRQRGGGAASRRGGEATARGQRAHTAATPQRRERSELAARLVVALPAALVAVVFLALGGLAWALFLIALGWACLHELYRLLERWRPLAPVGFAVLAGLVLAGRYGTPREVLAVGVAALPLVFIAQLGRVRRGHATVAIAGTLLGVWWVGVAFAHAALLRELPHGGAITADVLAGTFLGDTAAYLGGRLFGRHALAPSISPGKTVEGLFCGALITIVTVFVARQFQSPWLTQGHALALALTVAVLAPIGDLFESLVKRDAAAKDTGTLFGAHGGALDRADAALFTVVGGFYVWLAMLH